MVPHRSGPRYERLDAWQAAHRLVLEVYRVTRSMPREERYGLTSQIRRAAISVASNLVEGSMRSGRPEYRRFVGIGIGSLFELRYQLFLIKDLQYLPQPELTGLHAHAERTSRLMWGLFRALGGVRDPHD
jgi:four helix bundle protein